MLERGGVQGADVVVGGEVARNAPGCKHLQTDRESDSKRPNKHMNENLDSIFFLFVIKNVFKNYYFDNSFGLFHLGMVEL